MNKALRKSKAKQTGGLKDHKVDILDHKVGLKLLISLRHIKKSLLDMNKYQFYNLVKVI
jgi:hypothetical protein